MGKKKKRPGNMQRKPKARTPRTNSNDAHRQQIMSDMLQDAMSGNVMSEEEFEESFDFEVFQTYADKLYEAHAEGNTQAFEEHKQKLSAMGCRVRIKPDNEVSILLPSTGGF